MVDCSRNRDSLPVTWDCENGRLLGLTCLSMSRASILDPCDGGQGNGMDATRRQAR